jgi:hypothetical protein
LQVPSLPEDTIDELIDSMGSPSEHNERMKRYEEIKAEYVARYRERRMKRGDYVGRNSRYRGNLKAINAAFLREEKARERKALDDPEGRQGVMKAIRDALTIKAIRETLIE